VVDGRCYSRGGRGVAPGCPYFSSPFQGSTRVPLLHPTASVCASRA
jgi:hypothetical protein